MRKYMVWIGVLLAGISLGAAAPGRVELKTTDGPVSIRWNGGKMTVGANGVLTVSAGKGTAEVTTGSTGAELLPLDADQYYLWQLDAASADGGKVRIFADYRAADGKWMHRDQSPVVTLSATSGKIGLPLLLPPFCKSVSLGIVAEHGTVTLGGMSLLPTAAPEKGGAKMEKPEFWVNLDYFDEIAYSDSLGYDNYGKEAIDRFFAQCKEKGVYGVHWRISLHGHVLYHSKKFTTPPGAMKPDANNGYLNKTVAVMRQIDPLREAVRAARENGIKIYVWVTLSDEAGGNNKSGREIYCSQFLLDNPSYALLNRQGQPLWGTLCYNIPAVRQYRVDMIRELAEYGADGIFLCNRSHAYRYGRDRGDEYGFNPEIVEEYRRRYGKDILKESFDVAKWQELKAEGIDLLIEEIAAVLHAKGQKLRLGIADGTGEKWGWVWGNARFHWKKQLEKGWIDSIVLGQGILTANKMREEYAAFRSVASGDQKAYFWMQLLEYGNGKSVPASYLKRQYEEMKALGGAGGIYHEAINLEVSEPYFNELIAPYHKEGAGKKNDQ